MSPKVVYVVVVLRSLMSKLCILKYMMGVGKAICETHGSKQWGVVSNLQLVSYVYLFEGIKESMYILEA